MFVHLFASLIALESQALPAQAAPIPVAPSAPAVAVQAIAPATASAEECEALVGSMSNFDVALAKRHAERLRRTGCVADQMAGFAHALRSRAWLEAINTEGQQREAAIRILALAKEAYEELEWATGVEADQLDPLVAALDASLRNAFSMLQAVHSIRIEHRIDCATATLDDARPWWWWNSAEGERNAGRIAAAAQRDRELADLRSGTLIDGFLADAVGGLPQSERQGYLRVTGLDVAKPIHAGLIPASMRLWDWRDARIEAPEEPQAAIRVPQKSAGGR